MVEVEAERDLMGVVFLTLWPIDLCGLAAQSSSL